MKKPGCSEYLRHRHHGQFISLALFVAACSAPALACPFCKDSVSTDQPAAQTAESPSGDFNGSIYAMLTGLAAVGGFTGMAIVRAVKTSADP